MLDGAAGRVRALATPLTALHVLLTALGLTVAFGCFDGTLFGWHPFAMSLGELQRRGVCHLGAMAGDQNLAPRARPPATGRR